MIWLVLVFAIVGVGLSIWLCVHGSKEPLTIKFSYMPIDWFIPVFMAMIWVMLAFAVEFAGALFLVPKNPDKSSVLYLLIKAYDNGLLIPVLSVVVSLLFYNSVKSLHLQYLPLYSEKVPKVCFTVIVLSFCIVLKIGVLSKYDVNERDYDLMLNRILMWALAVLGTVFGFGFGCRSVEEKDNRAVQEDNEGITKVDKIKFWLPIAVALAVCVIVMFLSISSLFDEIFIIFFSFALAFLLVGAISLSIIMSKKNPSVSKSKENFMRAKRNHKQSGYGEGQFRELSYCLDKDMLIIKPRTVIYKGHEEDDEFKDLFGRKDFMLEESDDKYDKAWRELDDRFSKQDKYIKAALDDCIKAEEEKKRVKFK